MTKKRECVCPGPAPVVNGRISILQLCLLCMGTGKRIPIPRGDR